MTGSFRNPREPPEGSPARVHPQLLPQRGELDQLRVYQVDLAKAFLGTGNSYPLDWVLATVMGRSYSLVDGFLNAFDTWNLVVAAPILRMQIDNLVRVHYLASDDGVDVPDQILGGEEFRNMTDSEGKKLTDRRLTELAESDHPWIRAVYDVTSGWVHFSPEHLRAAMHVRENEDGTLSIGGSVPISPKQIPLRALEELLGAMHHATRELSAYMGNWREKKEQAANPPGDQS